MTKPWGKDHYAVNATTAPTVGDDGADGYQVGDRWIDTTTAREYVCVDASVGAAVWKETTITGGGSTPTGTGFRHVTAGAEDAAAKQADKLLALLAAGAGGAGVATLARKPEAPSASP